MLDSIIAGTSLEGRLRRLNAAGSSSSSEENVDTMIQETIAKIVSVENRNDLNGFNIPRLTTQVKKYLSLGQDRSDVENIIRILLRGPQGKSYLDFCRNKEDFKYVVELLQNNAEQLLGQLNQRYNTRIGFGALLDLRRQHPQQSLAQLLVYLVADSDPALAPYATKILPAQTISDPHIHYVNSIQSQIRLTSLDPGEIYARTNAEDIEYLQTVENQKADNASNLRRRNYKRLANLEIEKNNSPEERLNYLKARIQQAMEAEVTPA
jgi:hypothetical protein